MLSVSSHYMFDRTMVSDRIYVCAEWIVSIVYARDLFFQFQTLIALCLIVQLWPLKSYIFSQSVRSLKHSTHQQMHCTLQLLGCILEDGVTVALYIRDRLLFAFW